MKRWLVVLAVSLGLLAPAAAFWQSRDSNYNVAVSGGTPFSLTHITDVSNNSSLQNYSFATTSVGTADPTRIVAVGISWIGTQTISSVTIGGNTASHATNASGVAGGGNTNTDIYYLAVPTGTTATIAVNLSATGALRMVVNVYSVIGTGAAFSTGANTDAAATSLTFATAATATIPSGGGAIVIVSAHSASAGPFTATNFTLDTSNLVVGGSTYGCGHNTSGSGSTAFNAVWLASTDAALSVATFTP